MMNRKKYILIIMNNAFSVFKPNNYFKIFLKKLKM